MGLYIVRHRMISFVSTGHSRPFQARDGPLRILLIPQGLRAHFAYLPHSRAKRFANVLAWGIRIGSARERLGGHEGRVNSSLAVIKVRAAQEEGARHQLPPWCWRSPLPQAKSA